MANTVVASASCSSTRKVVPSPNSKACSTGGFVSKWFILAGAFEASSYVAIFTIIASTLLNAVYFLPIVFAAWFGREPEAGGKDHGEAPWPAVAALTVTAALTILFFLFNAPVVALERQLIGAMS